VQGPVHVDAIDEDRVAFTPTLIDTLPVLHYSVKQRVDQLADYRPRRYAISATDG